MREPVRRHRTTSIAVFAAVAALALAGPSNRPAEAGTPYIVYSAEAELFDLPVGGSLLTSAGASRGAGILLEEPGTARSRATIPTGSHVLVRARAGRCAGVPRLVVSFDGTELISVDVPSATWTEFVSEQGVEGGTYDIGIRYDDDPEGPHCARRLSVDGVWILSDVPTNQTVPGSECEPTDGNLRPRPVPDTYDTSTLGDARGYYEVGMPDVAPKGVMLVIHGGGWFISGPGVVSAMRDRTDRWRDEGWITVSITSDQACGRWLEDVTWFYDTIDEAWGLEVCVHGASAGGQLAAMLATQRAVACVIGEGAPTDLESLDRQTAYDPSSDDGQATGPRHVQVWASSAFGADTLGDMSPYRAVAELDVPTLFAVAEHDGVIPVAQSLDITAALDTEHPDVEHVAHVLEPGPLTWTHASVSRASLEVFWSEAERIASDAVGG